MVVRHIMQGRLIHVNVGAIHIVIGKYLILVLILLMKKDVELKTIKEIYLELYVLISNEHVIVAIGQELNIVVHIIHVGMTLLVVKRITKVIVVAIVIVVLIKNS